MGRGIGWWNGGGDASMNIRPANFGGRIIRGDTPYGRFRFEVDRDGVLVDYVFDVRTPEPTAKQGSVDVPRSNATTIQPPAPRLSPGSLLTTAIKLITGEEPGAQCKCKARSRKMDSWGWMKCWRERAAIAEWLVEEAQKRNHEIDKHKALSLFKAAWKEIRQRRKDEAT